MKNLMKVLFCILLIFLTFYLFYHFIWLKYSNKYSLEKSSIALHESSENSPFSIAKVVVYSSGYGVNKNTTFQQNSWVLDVLQYSDIAIYIKNSGEELNSLNTVKKLFLENIQISPPKIGLPNLYYLDSLNFGTPNRNENFKIADSLEFTVLNDANKENRIQYNTPTFFTDCSNPITLKYVNEKIKENFEITSHEPIFFDGKLLKMANIDLADLEMTIGFRIHVVNYENEDYFYDFSLPIDLKNEEYSIYEGNILSKRDFENLKFIKEF